MNRKIVLIGLLFVLFVIQACSLPAGNSSQAVTETLAETALPLSTTETPMPPTMTMEPSQTTEASLTSSVTAATTPCNWAEFVSDVNYPDDSVIIAGSQFVKTWSLKNVGTCAWTSSYSVIFVSGDQMGAAASTQLTTGGVSPGGIINVSVSFTAPQEAGTYLSYFKLADGSNTPFGIGANAANAFWVQIVSEESGSSGSQVQVPSVNFSRTLKVTSPSMTGDDVEKVQNRLADLGYTPGIADGVYGAKTANAVKAFQSDEGLTADGVVGSQTWAELFN
ncbi:MAG: peptidoglycan-binding protein [Anaerolineaceae bacterium]|nr:peptidoglycan-binding protein [Anaerolineaceae bacterium]